jgi:SAM-dependent methyltransferase
VKINRIHGLSEYINYQDKTALGYAAHLAYLALILPKHDGNFTVRGYSYVAEKEVDFLCDFKCSSGYPHVNWRERVVCPITAFNNRMRAAIWFFDVFSNSYPDSPIYIMEQTTPVYRYLKDRYINLVGSEYLGDDVPFGEIDERGVRNEDATALSFNDKTLDTILSFDVFEHIYDYRLAFAECSRVLKENGCMIFTVPFSTDSTNNIERAVLLDNGEINHLLPPEYHGDPLSSGGILCYRHYGWRMLEDLVNAGFKEAFATIINSVPMGHYTNQLIFFAKK